MLNKLPVADGIMLDVKFQNAQEQEPPATGSPSIEPKHEFVQVAVKLRRLDRALMRAKQPPLDQRVDPVGSGQETTGVFAACRCRLLVTGCWLRRT